MMQDIFLWVAGSVLTAVFGLVGWAWRTHNEDIKMLTNHIDDCGKKFDAKQDDLEKRLDDHRLYAAETFATKNEVNAGFDRVMLKLDKIDDKLDKKVDK